MNAQEAGGIVAIIAALIAAYIAWRKWPSETRDITVTTADKVNTMTLRFADSVSGDNDDLRKEIDELRAEFRQYRDDTDKLMAQLKVELRAERAEKENVQRENESLIRRVDELESEVRALKAKRTERNET